MRFLRVAMPAVAILISSLLYAGPAVHPVAQGCIAPTVTSISPNSGPTAGGTAVTITGTGFFNPVTVTIGGAAATSPVAVNSTTVTAVTPAGAAGPADVVVSVGVCGSATLAGGFTYGSAAVPALSPLALALLAVSLAVAAVFVMRR